MPRNAGGAEGFPETRTEILEEAAQGNWTPFLDAYLRPCWREVVIACRSRHIPLPDADDLYQELMVRLIRDAGFNRRVLDALAEAERDSPFRGNLPGRYLEYRKLAFRSARFRTYLKRVIHNLVLEAVRRQRRQPKRLSDESLQGFEPWMERSISHLLDRQWTADCLKEAVSQLRAECDQASTRGQRRLFKVLYLATIEGRSAGEIAEQCGVHRTTIAELLGRARKRLIELLSQVTGIKDPAELTDLLSASAEDLNSALRAQGEDLGDCSAPLPRGTA